MTTRAIGEAASSPKDRPKGTALGVRLGDRLTQLGFSLLGSSLAMRGVNLLAVKTACVHGLAWLLARLGADEYAVTPKPEATPKPVWAASAMESSPPHP